MRQGEWVRSSFCASGPNCLEVKSIGGAVFLRDSKNPEGPMVGLTDAEWDAFLAGAKSGQFDR